MLFASVLGLLVAGGVTAAFAAGQLTADATGVGGAKGGATAGAASAAIAASQHDGAAAKPQAPPIDPDLLHAANYLTAHKISPTDAAQQARELECLTAAVYFEARGESAAGQAAVAQVVLNRVRHPAFPKSVCGVVYQGAHGRGCQFSFACNGAIHAHHEAAAWDRARAVAERAMGGYVMADVGRATHFHVTRLGSIWGGGMVKIARVGGHDFYTFSGRHPAPGHRGAETIAPDAMPPGPPADGGGADVALVKTAAPAAPAPAEQAPAPAGS